MGACPQPAGCAIIHLTWLEATGGAPGVAARLNARITELMRTSDERATTENTPELIAHTFQREFEAYRDQYPRSPRRWRLMGSVSLAWRSRTGLLTFDAPSYQERGDAHATSHEHFRVVDAHDGRALEFRDIVADRSAATPVVERFFRRAKRVPDDGSLAEYGWSFAHDRFALPPDIGLSADGVIFHWDPFVIGPYLAGATTLVVPYDSLRTALTTRVLP